MDLDAAREVFETSQDLTVGIEEEWGLVDPRDARAGAEVRGHARRRRQGRRPQGRGQRRADLLRDRDPLRPRGERPARAGAAARGAPAAVRARRRATASRSPAPARTRSRTTASSTSSTPSTTAASRTACSTSRGATTRSRCRSTSAIQGGDRAIKVCDRLRPVLPTLLAISANSPFVDGRDSGLHSARSQTFTKSFPRCGIPDVFGSWQSWHDYVALLLRTNSIVEFTQLWWSVRPHHSFGTIEVRDLRRADHRHRGRRAGRADRGLRRPGAAARSTRARRRPTSPAA